ncbi:cation:proton antiporter [Sandaracinus amylolyticus]|uniref:Sodium/hydrogen exchanger n=1 Tax=Sandaracinus amylolyticus TaxID=927083 RepID=A0A0F6SE44_9BACT|nr:cation:proton antiporter [Sandaracinus amylolyticus]AKF04549.1 Sodium/hydrogen exchanger [Sandaracinus amylolyticus]
MSSTRRTLLGPLNAGRTLFGYAAMIAITIALFFVIRAQGATLVAPPAPEGATGHAAAAGHASDLAHLLLAIAVVVIVARLTGAAFERWLKQPAVMGEIVAGLVLGPSVLGAIAPDVQAFLLPAAVAPSLGVVAKIGVVLFMFLVGLELDPKLLRGSSHATLAISHASIIAPFLLGATLALAVYPIYSHAGIDFTVFALFFGVSMSVTAFPVLARILTDRRMQSSALGVTALACAAVDDASAWCLLAFVSGVATAELDGAWLTIGLVVAYVAFVLLAVRPLARWLAAREERSNDPVSITTLAIVLGMLLLSAAATEAIGIHALFGAFLFGVVIPHDGRLAEQVRARLEDVVGVLLVPIFFSFTGMRTQIGLVSGATDWLICAVIILVATLGKFGGTLVAARFAGLGWRDASALGILMNTRGLMELIVLNVGLDMGVLSPTLFAMLVLMALVTTFATTPVLALITRLGRAPAETMAAERTP